MLDLSFNFRCYNRIVSSIVCIGCLVSSSLNAVQYWNGANLALKNFEQDWIVRYFNSIDENTEVGEVVDFLVFARTALVAKGYKCPSLMELAIRMKEYLVQDDIEINGEEIQELYEEIYQREQMVTSTNFEFASTGFSEWSFEFCKHKPKDKDKKEGKEIKLNSKGVYGFLKCLAGGLICVIPIPAVQAVGVGLVLNGVNDIIDGAREQGDENERLQKLDEQRRQEAAMLEPQK